MDWLNLLEKKLFTDHYGNELLGFLARQKLASEPGNSEKWERFFKKAEKWKKQYLISSEAIEIYGVNGWYVDFTFSQFQNPADTERNMEEYAAILFLTTWFLSMDNDDLEFYKNSDFSETVRDQFDYSKEECAHMVISQLMEEWKDIYERSYERFQYYKHCSKSSNPEVIAWIETQYPKLLNYMDHFGTGPQDYGVLRLNSFGRDEDIRYFIKDRSATYSIWIREII